MTTKEQIIRELEPLPEPMLVEVLDFVLTLKEKQQLERKPSKAVQAFLASLEERKEVYRRLADS